jgi:hypothetical protein
MKEDEMGRTCSTDMEMRTLYRILAGKSKGKRPLGRTRRRWIHDNKIYRRETE